ncbi:MAG: RsmB/NOP family class I SAM-dependent RNA methyltransferase [Alphaproteobacteria bacterium]|nr:RsmB/NOP family class I SAM-dependent RNA methyltransferase [Alphaproteobacteria bacterium]
MREGAKIQSAITMLDTFFDSSAPFDIIMAKFFKNNKWIGAHDRHNIAEFSYNIFRNYEKIKFLTTKITEHFGRFFVLSFLKSIQQYSDDKISELFSGKEFEPQKLTDFERRFISNLNIFSEFPKHALLNYPEWMTPYFEKAFSCNFDQEMNALNQKAFVDIRINTLKSNRKEVEKLLTESQFEIESAKLSTHGIRILNGRISRNHPIIKNGLAEIQDEGSQLIATICNASQKDTVIDFCAGAGGKTLAIAASMNNKGRIFALDKYPERLENAKLRFRRANVNNVICQEISSKWIKRHKECANIVLVDAPCSGTGTWRRNPDMRAKFHPKDLNELVMIQAKILETAHVLVKKNGRIIYSTCSVLTEENEEQINLFLKKFPNFRSIMPQFPNLEHIFTDGFMKLSPFRNGTDGFFAACLERIE